MPKRKWSGASLTIQVPVPDDRTQAETGQEGAEGFHEHHRPMPPARAAHGDREVGLPFALVERQEELEQSLEPGEELAALRERHHVLLDRAVAPVQGAQLLDEARGGEEPDSENEIAGRGDPVLEATRYQRPPEPAPGGL